MNAIEKIHTLAVHNRCFGQSYNSLEILELLELQVNSVDRGSVTRSVDELLLKLTTIDRIFQLYLSRKRTCEKLNDICYSLISNLITRKLICCLKDKNQHVVFIASKALSSLMLSVPLTSTTKSQLEGLFQGFNTCKWKSLYVMDILKQVIEGCLVDDTHNLRVKSKMSSICSCVSGEREMFEKGERENMELLHFIVSRDWISIVAFYIPFWEDVFISYIDDAAVFDSPKWTTIECLEYHMKLSSSIHHKLTQCCFDVSANDEQVFLAFLSFLAKFIDWKLITKLEIHEEIFLLKIIPVMPSILNIKDISSDIWKKIQKLLSYALNTRNTSISTKSINYSNNDASINKCIINSAAMYISAIITCHILDSIHVHAGSESFGGSTVKPAQEILTETCKTEVPNSSVFRQASLLVLKASLVLFNRGSNHGNVSRIVFQSLNIWFDGLLKIGTSNHSQREPSNHSNQKIYQREPRSHSNQGASSREPSMILMDVFAEQDDEMIKMMLLLLQLFKIHRNPINQDAAIILNALNPHLVFQEFLKVIGFDHSVLLDFLISTETIFLEYLMEYLRFILQDWKGFCQNRNTFNENITTTEDVETDVKYTMKTYLQYHHSDGLSGICFAYGSDIEDDSDDDDYNDDDDDYNNDDDDFNIGDDVKNCANKRKNCSDCQERVEDLDIQGCDSHDGISNDTIDHTNSVRKDMAHLDDGKDIVRKDLAHLDDMASTCNDDRDLSDVTNSRCKSKRNHDDDIVGIHYCGDVIRRDYLADEFGTDDDDESNGKYDVDGGMDYEDDNGGSGGDGDSICHDIIPSAERMAVNPSSMLENTMSTLIHTRIAVERLNKGSLFPYRGRPLINLMTSVENLYDGC